MRPTLIDEFNLSHDAINLNLLEEGGGGHRIDSSGHGDDVL
jgi:hypothetical protein